MAKKETAGTEESERNAALSALRLRLRMLNDRLSAIEKLSRERRNEIAECKRKRAELEDAIGLLELALKNKAPFQRPAKEGGKPSGAGEQTDVCPGCGLVNCTCDPDAAKEIKEVTA